MDERTYKAEKNDKGEGCLGCLGLIVLFLISVGITGAIGAGGVPILSDLVAVLIFISLLGLIYGVVDKIKSKDQERVDEVNNIIDKYKVTDFQLSKIGKRYYAQNSLLNKDVISTVNKYKEKQLEMFDLASEVDGGITEILKCEECTTIDEKRKYLKKNIDVLERLKKESDYYHDEINNKKIQLLNENKDLLWDLKKFFLSLINSKKCVSEEVDIKSFLKAVKKPAELALFSYNYEPAMFNFDGFTYCLFSNVILVFDDNGTFSTALDPSAISIKLSVETCNIYFRNNETSYNEFVAEDSKRVSEGYTRRTYLHTCRDGSVDLRYSYNPQIEYRTDVYEYVVLTIKIIDKEITFTASSQRIKPALNNVAMRYFRKCNKLHDPIPDFIVLLKTILTDDSSLNYIENDLAKVEEEQNYFCKIVEQ